MGAAEDGPGRSPIHLAFDPPGELHGIVSWGLSWRQWRAAYLDLLRVRVEMHVRADGWARKDAAGWLDLASLGKLTHKAHELARSMMDEPFSLLRFSGTPLGELSATLLFFLDGVTAQIPPP